MKNVDKRNASPSAYGWVFQVNAGITLMLENIKDFTSIKMEGKSDDIEISFDKGKIYAQAKSTTQIGNQKNASHFLNNALKVLTDDYKENDDVLKLVYITNISNPLSSKTKSAYTYEHIYDFSILPKEDQDKLRKRVDSDFPLNKFQIHILNFFGEGDNKFASLKNKISEFLREAINDPSYNKKLLDSWFESFMVNCADKPDQNKSIELSKDQIVLPVIILVIDQPLSEDELSKVSDYDCYDELKQSYRRIINQEICDYQFCSKVIGDFIRLQKSSLSQRQYKYQFVKEEWKNYEDDFLIIKDSEEREAIIKLILLTIITSRYKIQQIKEATQL